jgi:hypothetical protein
MVTVCCLQDTHSAPALEKSVMQEAVSLPPTKDSKTSWDTDLGHSLQLFL